MKLWLMVKDYFLNPKKDARELLGRLFELKKGLFGLTSGNQPLEDVATLFVKLNYFYRDGYNVPGIMRRMDCCNYDQYNLLIDRLHFLHMTVSGVLLDRMNQTFLGDVPTKETIFLGGIEGLLTKPISFWMEEGTDNAKMIVSTQARRLIDKKVSEICTCIDELNEELQK